ncbi:hypothetical protein VOLCADRAFT_89037 [Volvox carteri f. nagariensis]|uniref:GIY-YIG domain-containing protein n=1 Tax=Volvox carteri f. nagariensis TaxID=3068 RepID=D8TQM4_VOLCA|nr:uncharacterized protein VOLCADRAFT_89037 [Volvox carteri f. nagariensis]EFJ50061.1 hypothetical protein VOLCADRAFT_89037 [Volvox carteri f. nagariensis]|eukprot:XP_002948681.1 hypothetical protein VOLCADRAFT_89037 [Volvox carteri f. nagariensis]
MWLCTKGGQRITSDRLSPTLSHGHAPRGGGLVRLWDLTHVVVEMEVDIVQRAMNNPTLQPSSPAILMNTQSASQKPVSRQCWHVDLNRGIDKHPALRMHWYVTEKKQKNETMQIALFGRAKDGKGMQGRAREGKGGQGRAREGKGGQGRAREGKGGQGRAEEERGEQETAEEGSGEQGAAEEGMRGQGRASCVTDMDAAENLEQVFSVHMAAPALAVLQQLRKDLSKQQAQKLLDNHRKFLQLGTCSFGRRGRASYALRTEAEVQRLCNIANISGPQGAAEVRVAHTHDGCMCSDVGDTGTADTSSMHIDLQPTRVRVGNAEPSSSTGQLRVPLYARSDISNCAVVPLDAHATCVDCVRHGLIAAGATDVPAPEILLATVVGAIAESWDSMRFQVLHAHASSLPSTCTATQYGEALQQHRLLPGDVELAVLAHAFNIAITVFDPAGLQICYWGSSSAPTEVCLIRQSGLAGTPLPYRLLDMVPAEVMQLWIAAAGSLRADTAIELIYDYGMDAGTVLKADQDFARSVLTAAQQARASGALLTTTTPAKRAASSPAEPDSSAPARTVYVGQSRDPQRRFQAHARNPPSRMKEDASRYQPFHDHFLLTRLMSTANPALAQRMEAFYIAQFKARGPGGYNVLCGPPSASPAFYAMRRRRAGSAHTPTAVTVTDDDDDAPATLA